MSARGIMKTIIATEIVNAILSDKSGDGYDFAAGEFGTAMSAWIRKTADTFSDQSDQIAALRNVVQAGMIAGCKGVFDSWNHQFPNDQRTAPPPDEPVGWNYLQQGVWHYTEDKRDWYDGVNVEEVVALFARTPANIARLTQRIAELEALTEKFAHHDYYRDNVVMEFNEERVPDFSQGFQSHELLEPVTAERCKWFVSEIERLTQRVAELEALSVTNILIDVVPGDGSGLEIYAKSVADVEACLTKLGERVEELEGIADYGKGKTP